MSKTSFNAAAFLNQTVEAVLDTRRIPMPEGEYDVLQIQDVELNSGTVRSGDNAGKTWVQLKCKMVNPDPNVRAEMSLEDDQDAVVYFQEFLDLDDNGNLDVRPGKNVKLGKLRHAAGQNTDEAWTLLDLKGASVGGIVKHELNKDGDPYAVLASVYNPSEDEEDE